MPLVPRIFLVGAVTFAVGVAFAADAPLTLSEDGAVFVYRAQPGDRRAVADRFGVRDLAAFLAANGITDPTRVAIGHVYRIPNPLAVRAVEAETRATALQSELDETRARVAALEAEIGTTRGRADELERRSSRLERFARLWPLAQGLGLIILLAFGAALYVAVQSVGRMGEAKRYARRLSDELNELRQHALAERQGAARQVLDLEARVRDLETQLARQGTSARPRPTGTH